MLQYTILLFGPAATATGADRIEIESPEPCSCDELKALIARVQPVLDEHLEIGRLAVNQRFVVPTTRIDPADEIALITMVSGG